MTYQNFGPEMLNAGRSRRPAGQPESHMQRQERDFRVGSMSKGTAVNDLTRELEAIANELGRLKASQTQSALAAKMAAAPSKHTEFQRQATAQPKFEANELNALVQSLKNDVRTQMRDDLDMQYVRLRDELDGLSAAIAGTSLQNAFKSEISQLVAGLETLAKGNRSIQNSQDKLTVYLEQELSGLQHSLQGLARSESLAKLDDRWNSLENRWNQLEDKLDNGLNVDSTAHFTDISARIAALHNKMNDGGLEALESRLLMLAKSVDALAQSRNNGAAVDFSQIDKRFDELSRAVAAIGAERSAPALDNQAVNQIEKAIGLLGRKIELVGSMSGTNPALDALEARLAQLNDRFAELPDYFNQEPVMERIDRLAEKVSAIPSPSLSPASIDALTKQLNTLATEIRSNTGSSPVSEGMFDRLDDRLGSIEERIQNLAFGETVSPDSNSNAIIAALEERFSELTAHLEAMQPVSAVGTNDGADFDALERKLSDISRQLMHSAEPSGDVLPFERLESQIADLALMLNRQPEQTGDTLTARFEALENLLSKNQQTVLESARRAAEEAALRFQATPSETDNSHIVGVIAGELATLEQLTRTSTERSTSAFEGIHGALSKIAERLALLEAKPAIGTQAAFVPASPLAEKPVAAPRMPVASFEDQAFFPATNTQLNEEVPSLEVSEGDLDALDVQAEAAERKARSPAEMAQEAAKAALRNGEETSPAAQAAPREVFDDVPLSPGANVPDLNSILKRVRDQKKAAQSQVTKEVDRKDHFLSIKRAAQAAAAEVQHVPSSSNGGGALNNAKALYGKFRRPILMIAAAAIVAIAALQLSSALLSSEPEQAAELPMQAGEQAVQSADSMISAPTTGFESQPAQSAPNEPVLAAPSADTALNDVSNIAPQAALPANPSEPTPRIVGVETPGTPAMDTANVAAGDAAAAGAEPIVVADLPGIPNGFGPAPLVEAAKASEAKAQFEMGRRLVENQSDPALLKDAFGWFNAAAAQGFAPAQYRVGNMYEKGLGVERSASEAKLWYQMAAEAGNASAMHNLAVLFASGADGTVDSASALRWFQKAADLGVGDSQFNLGVMMGKGQGVPQDLEESYKWLAILAKSGDTEAAAKRDEVGKTMRPEQIEAAKAKVSIWKPQPIIAEANDVSIPDTWKIAGGTTASVDIKKAVKNVQLILTKLGYNVGAPDGIMGENTRKAIRAFQKKENLAVTGEIDAPLVKALLAKNG